ncbi:MAG: hypothetical protein PHI24_14395 [Desulfitobacteriaceae bacterium]|nr:hypothetical protein [Desulfitobacteriaceae bacterium]
MTIEKTSLDAAIMTALAQLKSSPDIEHGKIVIAYLQSCVDFLNEKYIGVNIHLRMQDQYYNMKEKIEPFFHIFTLAERAMQENGIDPLIKPVRGGTDGARLSFMGLPCPNLFTGGHNFHSRYEFISLESMEAASQVIIKIIQLVGSQG